jgi:AraC family transcriptional regulator of arabinose operon
MVEYYHTVDTQSDCSVLFAGRMRCRSGHTVQGKRAHYLLHIVIEGRGIFYADGNEYRLTVGDAFLIFPRMKYRYIADRTHPWSYVWTGFSGLRAPLLLERNGIFRANPVFRRLPRRAAQHIATMADALRRRKAGVALLANGLLYETLSILAAARHRSTERRMRGVGMHIASALEYIVTNYRKPISVADVAEYAGLERTYFSKLFNRTMHESVSAFLTRTRMTDAKAMLADSELSVRAVAAAVGYTDGAAFARAFARRNGMSPSEYREKKTKPRSNRFS